MRVSFILLIFLLLACNKAAQKKTIGEKSIDPNIDNLTVNDVELGIAQPGEWRFQYDEKRQTFKDYQSSKPVEPDSIRHKLYLQPIGEFTSIQDSIVTFTSDYLSKFFQLEATVLPTISDNVVPKSERRFNNGIEQLHTSTLLDHLENHIPEDGLVIIAITNKDLYPSNDWNFVFGQARTKTRVAVSSLYRYSDQPLNASNYQICLERMIKTSSHEVGHMFGCLHCTYRVCLMNGSLSLAESDSRPNRLCSECLKKLQWNLRLDVTRRLNSLQEFFQAHHLERDHDLMMKDLGVFETTPTH